MKKGFFIWLSCFFSFPLLARNYMEGIGEGEVSYGSWGLEKVIGTIIIIGFLAVFALYWFGRFLEFIDEYNKIEGNNFCSDLLASMLISAVITLMLSIPFEMLFGSNHPISPYSSSASLIYFTYLSFKKRWWGK